MPLHNLERSADAVPHVRYMAGTASWILSTEEGMQTIQLPQCLFDFGKIKTGWGCFQEDQAPKPNDGREWKKGFHVLILLPQEYAPFQLREFVTTGVGAVDPEEELTREEVANVVKISKRSRRVAGICTGAFILAQAGLLDGKRATTHWAFASMMQEKYPSIQVNDDKIFITEGNIWTSAGMTAGLDLAVSMVEKDVGAEVARSVAHYMVMHHRRAGGQSQHSEMLQLSARTDRIQNALTYAKQNLSGDLSVERLAEVVHLSPRQFSRSFRSETGQSPAKAVEQLRIEAARIMLEESAHPLDIVARETGFVDRRRMRESFIRIYGQPPQIFRRNARASA